MPRTKSLAWAELKIGLLSLLALGIAATLIFALSGSGGFSWQRYPLKTIFNNISGLNEGAQVRIAGVPVGQVTGVAFVGDRVEVSFEIRKEMQSRVTDRSTAALGSVSLLGEGAVDITPSSQGTPIPDWGYVPSGSAAPSIAEVAAGAQEGITQLTAVLTDIRNGRGTVGQLFTNDSLYRDLNGLVTTAETVAQGIASGRGTLGRLINDPKAAQALEASLQDLQAVTARIRAGEGSLGKFLTDDAMSKSLTATTANFEAISGRINQGEGTAGALLRERELYDRMTSMTNRLDQVVAALQKGEGTAGQLLQDRRLYENMNSTLAEVQKLVAAITADPKRYLNIKVSLF
jgi:phospholipid/cholesterol/gamma-HCH transport system substrate-binding protein